MSKKSTNNSVFEFFADRLNDDDDEDIIMIAPSKKVDIKPQLEKTHAVKAEKKPKTDKAAKALEGIIYTYKTYQGRNKQTTFYLTPDNDVFLKDLIANTPEKRNGSKLVNKAFDEHRTLSNAGLLPEHVNYTFCMYSTKGRSYVSVALSEENKAYLNAYMKNNDLSKRNTAINKLLDEYRAMWKDMINRSSNY